MKTCAAARNQRNLSKQPVKKQTIFIISSCTVQYQKKKKKVAQEWKIPTVVILSTLCQRQVKQERWRHDLCIQTINEAENMPISLTGCCMFFHLPEYYKARHKHCTSESIREILQCKKN